MDIRASYKALKTFIRTFSYRKALFVYQERRLDVEKMDDDLLIAQIGYFGHHLEKTLKHHGRKNRGLLKRKKLERLLKEMEKRAIGSNKVKVWGEKLISYYDHSTDIYLEPQKDELENFQRDIIDFITTRKSTRFWKAKEIPDEIINKVIEAAVSASLSCNRQTIRFGIRKNRTENMIVGDSNNLSMFSKAPVLIYVADDNRFFSEKYGNALNVGSVCATLQLAAKAYGLSSTWIYFAESYNQQKIREELGFKEYHYIYSVIALGYPLDKQEKPPRFDIKNFIVNSANEI